MPNKEHAPVIPVSDRVEQRIMPVRVNPAPAANRLVFFPVVNQHIALDEAPIRVHRI